IPFIYDDVSHFSDGLCAACIDDKWGFINKEGHEVIPFRYIETEDFSQGLCAVGDTNNKWGFIDKEGNTVVPFTYDYTETVYGHFGLVVQDDVCGYINPQGKLIIPCEYDDIYYYSGKDPYIAVSKDNEYWWIMDHKG